MAANEQEPTAIPLVGERLGREDADRVGAKAANLGELLRAGFPVPPGIVVTGEDDEAVAAAALEAATRLGGGPFAVRSSISAEDGPDASFAGQYESVLGVHHDGIIDAVHTVRASVRAERVRRYQGELAGREIGTVGVLVQSQVDATVAGVAFSANPVTGATDEVVIDAVRGLGDGLVSGAVDPEGWVVGAGHPRRVRATDSVLTEPQVRELAETVRQVEAHFGCPIDVEWAYAGDRLWLVQARPITALPASPIRPLGEVPDGYWERAASHFPAPIAPMSRLILRAFTQGLSDAFRWAGVPADGVAFAEIDGWVYLRTVPLGGRQLPVPPAWLAPLANALAARLYPPLRRRIARLHEVERADIIGNLVSRWWERDRQAFITRVATLRDVALPTLSDDELREHLDAAAQLCVDGASLHHHLHLADIGFPIRLALLCHDHLGWSIQDSLAMLAGRSEASTEPGRALATLAERATELPEVRALLERPDRGTLAALEQADPGFAAAFHRYLRDFGFRALRYDVAEPTLGECPEVALGLIRDQLQRAYDAEGRARVARVQRDAAIRRARAGLADAPPAVRERFEWLLERAERAYPVREDNEFFLISAPIAALRFAALEAGRRLTAQGVLVRPEQVFLLEVDEVGPALVTHTDVRVLVERRAGEAAWIERNPGPPSYGIEPPQPSIAGLPVAAQEMVRTLTEGVAHTFETSASDRRQEVTDGRIEGIAASPGRCTGTVRVIMDEEGFDRIQAGDVLVCPITSPVWSVLFASVGALVTDTGGVLSHAAIIAREYRVPAVVGVGNATALLEDGQRVTVDGTAGVVTVHDARMTSDRSAELAGGGASAELPRS